MRRSSRELAFVDRFLQKPVGLELVVVLEELLEKDDELVAKPELAPIRRKPSRLIKKRRFARSAEFSRCSRCGDGRPATATPVAPVALPQRLFVRGSLSANELEQGRSMSARGGAL